MYLLLNSIFLQIELFNLIRSCLFIVFIEVSDIKTYVEQFTLPYVIVLYFFGHEAYLSCFSVVHVTISEHQFNILYELSHRSIVVLFQIFLDCSKIHGLFDYVIIVIDLKFLWVHWLIENPSLSIFG